MTLILVDFLGEKRLWEANGTFFLESGPNIHQLWLSGCTLKFLNVAGCYVNVNSSNNCLIFREQNSFGHKWDI